MSLPTDKSDAEIADWLAERVNRNGLSRVSPERFHAEKSDIAADLRAFGRRLAGVSRRNPSTTWRSSHDV